MTEKQTVVLNTLKGAPLTTRDIATMLDITLDQTYSRLKALEKKFLVRSAIQHWDNEPVIWELTSMGRKELNAN